MSRVYLDWNATAPLRPEARAAMIAAMDVVGNPSSVHGEGRKALAIVETARVKIKSAFGAHASKLMVSSTKSMTGHMMGATGALETVMLTNIVQKNQVPPTINYATPDPVCDLDYVPNEARDAKVDVAITNAFGFGAAVS